MKEQLAQLEQAIEEIRLENRQLRVELAELRERLAANVQANTAADVAEDSAQPDGEAPESPKWEVKVKRRSWGRWSVVILSVCVIVVPFAVLGSHLNAFWTTVLGALNALIVYFIGPGAIKLLAEGLLRAIPGILLGQTARITVDSMRKKRAR